MRAAVILYCRVLALNVESAAVVAALARTILAICTFTVMSLLTIYGAGICE